MNSAAYLHKHGWQGTGHALHPHKNHALKRPLLVSKKVDVLGLGTNKHANMTDQWWLKAFDSSLKDLGTGKTSLLGNVKQYGVKAGGLYGRFVKGEGFKGTIDDAGNDGAATPLETDTTGVDTNGVVESIGGSKKRKTKDAALQPNKKRKMKTAAPGLTSEGTRAGTLSAGDIVSRKRKSSISKKKSTRKDRARDIHASTSLQDLERVYAGLGARTRARYAARAAEKGIPLLDYFQRRTHKNRQHRLTSMKVGP